MKNISTTLFKGWNKEIEEWIYGSLIIETIQNRKIYYIADLDVRIDVEDDSSAFLQWLYEVDSMSVSQFTGFFDSTEWELLTTEEKKFYQWLYNKLGLQLWQGRLIFGSDILEATDVFEGTMRGRVVWNGNGWYVEDGFDEYLDKIVFSYYIIGNSYNIDEVK